MAILDGKCAGWEALYDHFARASRLLVVALAVANPLPGAGRTIAQYVHKSWTGKDGAPANIETIVQTADGFLWLASSQGLYRFDGVEFERLEPPGQPLTLASVYSLFACPNGDLWIGSAVSGISLWREGVFRNYGAADGLPEGAVLSLAQDRQGAIWAATQGGLVRFDGAKWKKIGAQSGFEGVPISLYVDRNGTLWASNPETVFDLPAGADRFRPSGIRVVWVTHMQESPDGTLWIARNAEVERMPPAPGPEFHVGSRQVAFDRGGDLWISSPTGGLRRVVHPEGLKPRLFEASEGVIETFGARDGLSSDSVISVYRDREGTIWVGTAGGLDRFTEGAVIRGPIPETFTNSVMAPGEGGDVWVGCLAASTGRVHENRWFQGSKTPAFSIVPDPDGGTWWAVYEKVGYREINGKFTSFDLPAAYATDLQPRLMTLDRSGGLWLAGSPGISVRRNGKWESIALPDGFRGKNVKVAYTDTAGRLWFGYRENTILLIDGSAQRVLAAPDGLRAGAVEGIFSSGAVAWVSGSNGLQLFDGRRFRDIVPADAAAFGSVSGVLETPDGSLWLNTYRGVVRIAPAAVSKLKAGAGSAQYSLFDTYDGLPGATQQSQPFQTLIQARDGRLWFGTSGGPASIDPNQLPRNDLKPPVSIRFIMADGKRGLPFADLRLPALTRNLEVDYSALSMASPERVRFRYRLEGAEDWRDAGTRRQAFYTNLGPGKYRFRVIACNNDGVWNEAGAVWSFSIAPAFYQTLWFELLCGLTVILLFAAGHRLRMRQAASAMKTRWDDRLAERTRMARDFHDTLLQTLQGSKIVADDALKHRSDPARMERALERLSQWMTQAIAEGRTALTSLRDSIEDTNDLAEAFARVCQESASENPQEYRISVEGSSRDMHPIVRDEVYRIVAEAIRNACLHSGGDELSVFLDYRDGLTVRVCDNGKGMDPNAASSGKAGHFGLLGMYERAARIKGKLTISSSHGSGTQMELVVPHDIVFPRSKAAARGRLGTRWRLFGN